MKLLSVTRYYSSSCVFQTIHDWMLALGVLGLIVVDVTILSIFTIINKNDLVAVAHDNRENPEETGGDDNVNYLLN